MKTRPRKSPSNKKDVVLFGAPSVMKLISEMAVLPQLGLVNLAGQVKGDLKVGVADLVLARRRVARAVREILSDTRPEWVGLSAMSFQFPDALRIARIVKAFDPSIRIVLGGYHATLFHDSIGRTFPKVFDYIVRSEGERTFRELTLGVEAERIEGLTWRSRDGFIANEARPVIEDLDSLPFPARHTVRSNGYRAAIYSGDKCTAIVSSRGCPFHCKFCDTSTFSARVRHYSPKEVFRMMKHLHDTYGVRHIMFVDDLFLASKLRTEELCNMILDSGLKMTWTCTARAAIKPKRIMKIRPTNISRILIYLLSIVVTGSLPCVWRSV